MRKLTVFCIAAVAVAFTASAFAAVQNVKVSGDLALRNFNRKALEMSGNNDDQQFMLNTARVRIDADLTDNVSTAIRLVNERDWGAGPSFDAGVDTAYVTMKEFFYAPLTLTIGRQPLWWGKGFVLGSNNATWDPEGSILANEYTSYTNFDAVKATLDYAPWAIEGIYTKIDGNATNNNEDDIEGCGLNVGYKFSEYNAEAESYILCIERHGAANVNEAQKTRTVGIRGSMDPLANVSLWVEGAYQWGKYDPGADPNRPWNMAVGSNRERSAGAVDVGGEYRFSDYAWNPKLGGEYIFYSGDDNPWRLSGNYHGWDPVFRGKYDTAIRDFQGLAYFTADVYDPGSYTNQHQFALFGGLKPFDTLAINAKYTHFRLAKALTTDASANWGPPKSRGKHLGDEVDVNLTYDYTEDVQFGLLGAVFVPGGYYDDASAAAYTGNVATDTKGNKTASSIVGSVKVTF